MRWISLGRHWYEQVVWALWVLFLLSLPFTSFPYFPRIVFSDAIVRPLALYPLALLLVIQLLPFLVNRGRLPLGSLPLIAFMLLCLLELSLVALDPSLPLRGNTPLSRGARGVSSLVIGMGVYLTAVSMLRDRERILATLRWLYAAYAVVLAWSAVQISWILIGWPTNDQLNEIQALFSVRDLRQGRVSGFAYEPSWLADQLVLLFLPVVMGAVLAGQPVLGRGKTGRLLEGLLLALGAVTLLFTYSRGGLASWLVSAGLVLVGLALKQRRRIIAWLMGRDVPSGSAYRPRSTVVLRVAGAAGAALASIAAGVWTLTRSHYFALVWTRLPRLITGAGIIRYLASIGGDIRMALAEASWRVFLEHPLLGVGLGQSGFYLLDRIPAWAGETSALTAELLSPWSMEFPNPKNLWLRLLAETGLVGSLLYVVFLLFMLVYSLRLTVTRDGLARAVGLAGIMAWIAWLFEGLTLDSFALPAIWLVFGLLSQSAVLLTQSPVNADPGDLGRRVVSIPP